MLNDVMGNCNIIVENIQKAYAKNAINKTAVFFLLAVTISMIMTLTPIFLIQEAKAAGWGNSGSSQPQQEDRSSLVGTYADRYDNGKAAADSTYNTGGTRDATCPSGHSFTYCLGYHVGYDAEWIGLKASTFRGFSRFANKHLFLF